MKRPSRREFLWKTAGASGSLALGGSPRRRSRARGASTRRRDTALSSRGPTRTPARLRSPFPGASATGPSGPPAPRCPTDDPLRPRTTAPRPSPSPLACAWCAITNGAGTGPAFGPAEMAYDPDAPGGTTTLVFDPAHPERPESFASLSGTSTNCAGGLTPWGSWLTCEETFHETRSSGRVLRHGYVFEVPSGATSAVQATPLRALGRFVHEAVAVDPETGIVYETEDADAAGFFRFVPEGGLAAGRLQMLAVSGRPNADTRRKQTVGRGMPRIVGGRGGARPERRAALLPPPGLQEGSGGLPPPGRRVVEPDRPCGLLHRHRWWGREVGPGVGLQARAR